MEDKFRRWIVCLCLVFVFPHVSADSYTFRSLSVSEGMPDLVVNSIYKDSRGFVWFEHQHHTGAFRWRAAQTLFS